MKHLVWLLAMILLAGCDIPQDPNGTLERVKSGVIRVGISENPPWTTLSGGQPGGIEVRLTEEIARRLGAKITWIRGSEADLIQSLHHFDLDLVIAGLTQDRPWKRQAAFTRPYLETTGRIGSPPGVSPPADIANREVLVREGSILAKVVRDRNAKAVPTAALPASGQLVAAEDWELSRWNYQPSAIELTTHQHVFAVPPGENGWLGYLERFLQERKEAIREQLHSGSHP